MGPDYIQCGRSLARLPPAAPQLLRLERHFHRLRPPPRL